MNPRTKVAIFATHPIQYHAPLWRRLAVHPEFETRVFFGTDMSVRGYRDQGFGTALKWDVPLVDGGMSLKSAKPAGAPSGPSMPMRKSPT